MAEMKRRRVVPRDHDEIARYIGEECRRREQNEYRKKHENRWREVDRQIEMEPPIVKDKTGKRVRKGSWHHAIQLGDLTEASETITEDALRLLFPSTKFFTPHVEIEPDEQGAIDIDRQKSANSVLRSLMVQQHKDFGMRGRTKMALKEMLHHGSVCLTVDWDTMAKYHDGTRVETLSAPVITVHSMYNVFPDSSPQIQGTEMFYKGSMIVRTYMHIKDALNQANWINKDKLQPAHKKKGMTEHVEILTFYGDIFLKRHDGNLLFPNRKTMVSNGIFLQSEVNPTPYPPVIFTGYGRDDVRDPYYTSPIEKRVGLGKFSTKMANATMDSVDLKVKPPIVHDSFDNSLKGNPPQIYPGSSIPTRGGSTTLQALDVGDPNAGLAAMQMARQWLQEGTNVDSVRKGVSPGTEQTATEIMKTDQRAELRDVGFVAVLEAELLTPFLFMQHDLNKRNLRAYPFYNTDKRTADFQRWSKTDLPEAVVFEVTGSKEVLGEEERSAKFVGGVQLAASIQQISDQTNWIEVTEQIWEDTRAKDPNRFMIARDDASQIQALLEQQKSQFLEQLAQMQEEMTKLKAETQSAIAKATEAEIGQQRERLGKQEVQVRLRSTEERLRLTEQYERYEDRLQRIEREVELRETRMSAKAGAPPVDNTKEVETVIEMFGKLEPKTGETSNE